MSYTVLALLLVVVGLFAGAVVLVRRLRRVRGVLEEFTAGNYTPRLPLSGSLVAAVNSLGDRLVELHDSQRSFVADASHQLRNPLVALRLRLENLEPHVLPEGLGKMESALREATRMSLILNALMTLARGEGRAHAVQPVDIAAVLEDRMASWRPIAAIAGVDLFIKPCTGLWANALPAAVDQILDVFIDNALRVSPVGSTIELFAESSLHQVRLFCRDEGPGMNPADAARACERYWRGTQRRDTDGAGLGLSIAAGLARASDGWLALNPAPGGGTDAVLVLRTAQSTVDDREV
ncbi:HAMP domain-containing sensor histidine kinase [Lentzea sp. BCCO 10_0856]|uniref:histidine kinase n=1 Tax=Lentzea miocenica TaxID=3095431 RepID=A0ABU4TEX5_9PSEU|nr:HAMP domain-containing sensor histidine kinase [Lentzea sp. BCCO 10_0856]MDX8036736.1 HAMP domain-containing sensor histidine kinase [Lentzea sp. BCCO 10_0856]